MRLHNWSTVDRSSDLDSVGNDCRLMEHRLSYGKRLLLILRHIQVMVVQSDCKQYKANTYSGATLRYLAKEGDIENHMSFQRASHLLTDIYLCWCS